MCSILYELLIAQALTAVIGGAIFQYTLTIGLYIFFLGVGSAYFERLKNNNLVLNFIILEMILCVLGSLGPSIVLVSDYLVRYLQHDVGINSDSLIFFIVKDVFSRLPIMTIGFLSGLEIPYLFSINRMLNAKSQVLAFDYLGSTFAGLIFIFFLIPYVGVMHIGLVTACCNFLAICLIFGSSDGKQKKLTLPFTLVTLGFLVLFAVYSKDFSHFIIESFYFR